MATLSLQELRCRFDAEDVVRGVSLEVEPGELHVILGPSGCGKTTLLRSVAGFHPAAGGRVVIAGEDRTAAPPERRGLGWMGQQPGLFPHMRVLANVAFGLHRLPRAERRRIASQWLERVGLAGMEQRLPHELSGGEAQRVALARALAPSPALVLMDEPFSALDRALRVSLGRRCRDVLKQAGAACLMVTHDQEEAFALADRLSVMQEGRIVQTGTAPEVYRYPASDFVAGFIGEGRILSPQSLAALGWASDVPRFIRPEAVGLADHGVEATVLESIYRGGDFLHRLRLEGGEELLTRTSRELTAGSRVRIALVSRDSA